MCLALLACPEAQNIAPTDAQQTPDGASINAARPDAAPLDVNSADSEARDQRHNDLAVPDQGSVDHLPRDASPSEQNFSDGNQADAGLSDSQSRDRQVQDQEANDLASAAYHQESLANCWTDANCLRVMAVGHGGLWNPQTVPYDSNAALEAAWQAGMDGVKIDVRVTSDNVPVISHSSPLEIWESLDCYNQRIEEMTIDEVTSCHRLPGGDESFQRLDDVLEYLHGKMTVQLCVKEVVDYGRTIEQIHSQNAENFAYIELSTSDLLNIIPHLSGSETVYYLVNVGSDLSELDSLLGPMQNPMAFMFEFDEDLNLEVLGDLVNTRLHPAGVRSFTYIKSQTASVTKLQGLYEAGYDVVSTNVGAKTVAARINVNQTRGIEPP